MMKSCNKILFALLFIAIFAVRLDAKLALSENQETITISFYSAKLEQPIGCIYIDDEYLTKLSPGDIQRAKTTLKRIKLLDISEKPQFEMFLFIEGISGKDTIKITQASIFSRRFDYIGEIAVDKDLQEFVFGRFNELRNIRAKIIAANAQWTAGLNPIFMLTDAEREHLLGLLPPPDNQKSEIRNQKSEIKNQKSSLDWRDKDGHNWLTNIRNQGGCGSCWAFAAVGQVEALVNIAENDPSIDLNLAEQTLVRNCGCPGDCNGGWHDDALSYIKNTGIPLEPCDPYTASSGPCTRCADWLSQARKITSRNQVTGTSYNETTIKNALQNHPVSTAVWADNGWYSYTGGIYSYTPSWDETINHAIVFVGWNDASNYWIIRNSWGAGWGESGYMRIQKGKCHLGWYTYDATYNSLFVDAGDDVTINYGDTVLLSPIVTGGAPNYAEIPPDDYTYLWLPSTGLSNPNIKNPDAYPIVTTTYTLTVTDLNVSKSDNVMIIVISAGAPGPPTLITLFDNEKTKYKAPTFKFSAIDPQGDQVKYLVWWDMDPNFGSPNSGETGLCVSGAPATYTIPGALNQNSTYWWKVKAKDPDGSGFYGGWSEKRSFTIDTTLQYSRWFQTKKAQFETDSLMGVTISGDVVELTSAEGYSEELHWDDGTATTNWRGVSYWGVKFEVPSPCTLLQVKYARHTDGSEHDTIYVRKDVGGNPGTILRKIHHATIAGNGSGEWYTIDISPYYNIASNFWVCLYAKTQNTAPQCYMSSDGDGGENSYYSSNGSSWTNMAGAGNPNDFLIRAIVKYPDVMADSGKIKSTMMVFDWVPGTNKWDKAVWGKKTASDSAGLSIEYLNGGSWQDAVGITFTTTTAGTIDISGLDPSIYDTIRMLAQFYKESAKKLNTPGITEWWISTKYEAVAITETPPILIYSLSQAFPNPFTHKTSIECGVQSIESKDKKLSTLNSQLLTLNIYDLSGRLVKTLVNKKVKPGSYTVRWDGRDNYGKKVSAGIYFYRLKTGEFKKTKKLVMLR